MEAKAILRTARISPQKARLVADQVRGLSAERAVNLLKFSDKKAAHLIKKVVESAIANAENNHNLDVDALIVSEASVGKTITMKREWPGWTPPPEMRKRRPDLPKHMEGGLANPLGARAMYLGSSLYRIHGSN